MERPRHSESLHATKPGLSTADYFSFLQASSASSFYFLSSSAFTR